MNQAFRPLLAGALALLLVACVPAEGAEGSETIALRSGGQDRRAVIVATPSPSPRPVLLLLHGRLGTAEQVVRSAGIVPGGGFILAAPDGYQRSWADGRGATPADRAGIDDVAYLRALVAAIGARHRIDPARIYVAGHSNGGFMAARLGCEAADFVSGIAIVAATTAEPLALRCRPARPVSVLLIHGTADPLTPFAGGPVAGGGVALSAEATLLHWATRAGCSGAPTTTALRHPGPPDGTSARRTEYRACAGGAQVAMIAIAGGGHGWPGGAPSRLPVRMMGPETRAVEASTEIRRFFSLPR